jgi:hypothetical protein
MKRAEASLVENRYSDAQRFDNKGLPTELQTALRQYLQAVMDREWPEQQAGRVSDAAEPALRRFELTLAVFKPANSGDAIVMQEMLRSLNELVQRPSCSPRRRRRPHSPLGVVGDRHSRLLDRRGHRACGSIRHARGFTTAVVIVAALIAQLDFPYRGKISIAADPFEHVLCEVGADGSAHLSAGAD